MTSHAPRGIFRPQGDQWNPFAIIGSKMPPRDPDEDEEDNDDEDEYDDEEDRADEPPVVREPDED